MNPISSSLKHLNKEFYSLYCAQFITAVSFSITLPIIPFIAISLGATPNQIAYIMGSNAIVYLTFTLILGFLSDRYGRRPIIIFSYAISSFSFYILGTANSIDTLFAARAMGGMHGAAGGVLMAYISDKVKKEHTTTAMGFMGSAITAGFVIGPVFIIILNVQNVDDGTRALQLAGFVSFLALVFVIFSMYFTKNKYDINDVRTETKKYNIRVSFYSLFALPTLAYTTILITAVIWCVYSGRSSTFVVSLEYLDSFKIKEVGLFYAIASLVTISVELFLISYISKKGWDRQSIEYSALILVAFALMVASFQNLTLLIIYYILLSAIAALIYPLMMNQISLLSNDTNKGALMGLAANGINFGQAIGPFVSGVSFYAVGVGNLGLVDAAIISIPILLLVIWRRIKSKNIKVK